MGITLRKLSILLALTVNAFDIYEYAKCQLCETAKPSGAIDDCCCDVETVDQANTRHFLPILHKLTKRTYFRYFKVDLWRSCPYWPEDGECAREECAVCECDQQEVPACWREEEARQVSSKDKRIDDIDEDTDARVAQLSKVNYGKESERPGRSSSGVPGWGLDEGAAVSTGTASGQNNVAPGQGRSAAPGYDEANVWSIQGMAASSADAPSSASSAATGSTASRAASPVTASEDNLQYVNLLVNPEGYTGYSGPKATRIWQAIYGENCFSGPLEGMCLEERVFYRLISGLQTSINTHIAMTHGNDEDRDGWDIYTDRDTDDSEGSSSYKTGLAAAKQLLGRAYTWMLNAVSRAGGHGPFPAVPEAYAPGNGLSNGQASQQAGPSLTATAAGSSSPSAADTAPHSNGSRGSAANRDVRLVLSPGLKPNVTLYHERIGAHPERLKNLYFAYLFLVRAVAKAQPLLQKMDFSTGNATDDAETVAAVRRLLDVEVPSVLAGFDESRMFQVSTAEFLGGPPRPGAGSGTCPPVLHGLGDVHELQHRYLAHVERKAALREAFRDKYRNISRILDCVGCEKCRLWGKLQFLGLGTAMKILFADADATSANSPSYGPYAVDSAKAADAAGAGMSVHLSRNELVALINVLHRVSMSLAAMHVMRDLEARERLGSLMVSYGATAAAGAVTLVVLMVIRRCRASTDPASGKLKDA